MFDEPTEDPKERVVDPAQRARDKSDEFRMHAELCAVFEGGRKFEADLDVKLDPEIARDAQKTIARLEKSRIEPGPIIKPDAAGDAERLLDLANEHGLSTNDYHVHRRPGETMVLRWLEGDQVQSYYQRLQAHFDAALAAFREDEKSGLAWKQDDETAKYLEALDAIQLDMEGRYLRPIIKQHKACVLSTQSADEMDIQHLCEFIMGIAPAAVVGGASAPPEDGATERDRAWFFKLFSLRGIKGDVEQMFFFAYLQKADDESW
jgi:hypothetical protein